MDGNILRRGSFDIREDVLCGDEANSYAQNGKAYQLYTLYRDKNGNIKQVTDCTDNLQIIKIYIILYLFYINYIYTVCKVTVMVNHFLITQKLLAHWEDKIVTVLSISLTP